MLVSETLTFDDLSDSERRVWRAVATGELVDLRNGDGDRQADLMTGAPKGLSPKVIRELRINITPKGS